MDALRRAPARRARARARRAPSRACCSPGGYQADLRLVPAESRGAAMQYFTGSKAHNIVAARPRDPARPQAERVRAVPGGRRRAASPARPRKESTRRSGWPGSSRSCARTAARSRRPPSGALPRLLTRADLRGDLHMHTTATDGRDDLETMAAAAQRLGHRYIAITDHSKALAMANGLDEHRALAHAARVRALNGRFDGLTLLAGIECDILADGTLDLADDCLAQLDFVVASVHSHFSQETAQMTDRAAARARVPVGRHPRPPDRPAAAQARAAAPRHRARWRRPPARHGVALEINARWIASTSTTRTRGWRASAARRFVISTDAHSVQRAAATCAGACRWPAAPGSSPTTCSTRRDARPVSQRRLLRAQPPMADVTTKPPVGFVSLKSLTQGPPDPAAALAEIRRIYFKTTQADDRARLRARHRPAEERCPRRGAREGRGLHAGPGADAARVAQEERRTVEGVERPENAATASGRVRKASSRNSPAARGRASPMTDPYAARTDGYCDPTATFFRAVMRSDLGHVAVGREHAAGRARSGGYSRFIDNGHRRLRVLRQRHDHARSSSPTPACWR